MVELPVVINPEGTAQRVVIADAIKLIEERDGRYTLSGDKPRIPETRRRKNRERYLRLKADPVRYKEYLDQKGCPDVCIRNRKEN